MDDDTSYTSDTDYLGVEDLTVDDIFHPLGTVFPPIELEGETDMIINDSAMPKNDSQSMDVTEAENAMEVEESPMDGKPSPVRCTWRIQNFSTVHLEKSYSNTFMAGGYRWRILIFPKGNESDYLSMYLDFADAENQPIGWHIFAQFWLIVVNQKTSSLSVRRESQHQFDGQERDWGFLAFMPLSDLSELNKGYIVDDTLIVEAEVVVRKISEFKDYDSKKETGCVGLKNQGATCYMNSLVQTLYHIPYFRKTVYHMPTTESDDPAKSIPLALQSLFYRLQYSKTSVSTTELTKSFGWDIHDGYQQHDVQEFNRVLCEKLENKMKGTVVEGTIPKLFEGHLVNYVECIHVEGKSFRMESYYDLQLDVKGCPDIYASFDKYCEVERLEGDNKYRSEKYGLQEAKKGCLFIDFPPVLFLHLKRFEYDSQKGEIFKIFDRYEFPMKLDLDKDNRKYLSADSDKSVRNLFTLYSVFVHSGSGVHGGHYYAFIRPGLSDQWLKFNDERASKEDVKNALEEQYGGEEELLPVNPGFKNTPFKFTKYSNAYMLVYVRESDKDKIICSVEEKDIAEHLRIRLKREQGENKHKEEKKVDGKIYIPQLDADQYTIIQVAQDSDLRKHFEKSMDFDLMDFERSFQFEKFIPFQIFKEHLAIDLGIPVHFMRLWHWDNDKHHISKPLSPQEEALSVGQLQGKTQNLNRADLHIFVEFELGADLQPIPLKDKSDEDMLLFFKLYDPEKLEIRYMGRFYVKASGTPLEILSKLNEMAEFSPNEAIVLYKEVKAPPCRKCKYLDKNITFQSCELQDGDIICYQKAPLEDSKEKFLYPDFPSFMEYATNRQVVHFRLLEKPMEDVFCLELSKLFKYDDIVARVAQQINIDDLSRIRLRSHNHFLQRPMLHPIKFRGVEHLSDMLRISQHLLDMLPGSRKSSDILYYEVLDIPLSELQCLRTLKVTFRYATKNVVIVRNIRLPENSTVGDILNLLRTKVELSVPDVQLRLLQVRLHKIYKIFSDDEPIKNIDDHYGTLHAEEIPEEEKNLCPNDVLVHVFHFFKGPAALVPFGEPFCMIVHEEETLADIKPRIQKKLQISDDECSKWRFAFVFFDQLAYVQDSDIISPLFQSKGVNGTIEQYLGLEHKNTTAEKHSIANQMQNLHTYVKPMKIYD